MQNIEQLSSELSFDSVELLEIPFNVGDQWFILREIDGPAHNAYQDAMARGISVDKDTKVREIKNLAVSDYALLAGCVFFANKSEEGTYVRVAPVPQATLEAWPYRITGKLLSTLKRVSGIEQAEKAAEENEPDPTVASPSDTTGGLE